MSTKSKAISTIKDAWKYAAEEESRPEGIPATYVDNRCLPNISSILSACNVSIKSGVSYEENQLIKYEDLIISPRILRFRLRGQTKSSGIYVPVEPIMISEFEFNGILLTQQQLSEMYTSDGWYEVQSYQNTRVSIKINAQYTTQSIIYKETTINDSFKSVNNHEYLLKDTVGHDGIEFRYTWSNPTDVDLNFFVVRKNDDNTYNTIIFGYPEAVIHDTEAPGYLYYPIKTGCIKGTPSKTDFPTGSDIDFCLSLDIDDTGHGSLTELMSLYPVNKTWEQIINEYDFVYAAIDYSNTGIALKDLNVTINSDFGISDEITANTTQTTVNSYLICRLGKSTGGEITEYLTDVEESLMYSSQTPTVPSDVTLIGTSISLNKNPRWLI